MRCHIVLPGGWAYGVVEWPAGNFLHFGRLCVRPRCIFVLGFCEGVSLWVLCLTIFCKLVYYVRELYVRADVQ